jgi:hypothetical protein
MRRVPGGWKVAGAGGVAVAGGGGGGNKVGMP